MTGTKVNAVSVKTFNNIKQIAKSLDSRTQYDKRTNMIMDTDFSVVGESANKLAPGHDLVYAITHSYYLMSALNLSIQLGDETTITRQFDNADDIDSRISVPELDRMVHTLINRGRGYIMQKSVYNNKTIDKIHNLCNDINDINKIK